MKVPIAKDRQINGQLIGPNGPYVESQQDNDMRINIDDEELWMLIDFNEQMAGDADESGEYEKAKNRRQRAKDLRKLASWG